MRFTVIDFLNEGLAKAQRIFKYIIFYFETLRLCDFTSSVRYARVREFYFNQIFNLNSSITECAFP